jgi:hypothetical protein
LYRKYLNARSPLRLLEKGLHGGLGVGNIGLVLAGHGVGKTAFLVDVAVDELLRSGCVLHVCLDQTVSHLRAYYDTIYEELASSTQLEDEARVHAEIDRRRRIRVYPPHTLTASKLREAVKLESGAGSRPSLLIVEGFELDALPHEEFAEFKAVAQELSAELWISVACPEERVDGIPREVQRIEDQVGVILVLEPGQDSVALRALKDHDSPDLSELHVALDPRPDGRSR